MSKLLEESVAYRPFVAPWAVEIAKDHEKMHWIEDEVPLGEDVTDWKMGKVKPNEKDFITQILRMFTQADCAVGGMYYSELIPKFRNNEVRNMLGSFACREAIHQRAYALLNDTLGLPEGDYAAFMNYVEMREKNDFMTRVDTSTKSGLALALAKGVFNEGVSLFASFVMLLNFQRRGLLKGCAKIVEWSVRDEGVHVNGVARLFRALCEENPQIVTDKLKHDAYDMAREVVRLEDAFVDLAYKMGEIEGLSSAEVKLYIRFIADRRLTQLGLKPNFNVEKNPLPWLDWILNAADLTSFFENRVTEYSVAGLQGDWGYPARPSHRYRVYWRHGCGYCDKAKALLTRRGLKFDTEDLTDDPTRQAFFNGRGFLVSEERTMPKIYVLDPGAGERLIGGYGDLVAHLGEAL